MAKRLLVLVAVTVMASQIGYGALIVDAALTDTSQIRSATNNPYFGAATSNLAAVNLSYGTPVLGARVNGIGFHDLELNANPRTGSGIPLVNSLSGTTFDFVFDGNADMPGARNLTSVSLTGTDAATANQVALGNRYISATLNHRPNLMTFHTLFPNAPVYVQMIGGQHGWNGDTTIMVNGDGVTEGSGTLVGAWESNKTNRTAGLAAFEGTTQPNGDLTLEVRSAFFSGLAAVIVQAGVPLPPPATRLPNVTSAALTAHFDASDINNDGGATDAGNGNDVNTWTDLVSTSNLTSATHGWSRPAFVSAGSGGIGGQDTLRFESTGGPTTRDIMSHGTLSFSAQTIFAVTTLNDNGESLSTLVANASHGLTIRQTTSNVPAYFSGNIADFVIHQSTAANGGTININGNRRLDIPGGFGAPHVLKAERTAPATYSGFTISEGIPGIAFRNWPGDVAEVIVFDAKLSGDDTLRVQSYLTGKYGIAFPTALDERITEAKQIALDPFDFGSNQHVAVNFHYGGPTAGTFNGIGFDNIDLAGGTPPTGPFILNANPATAGATLTLNFPFASDNAPRGQNSIITGPDATTLNTVANEFFYIGGNSHPLASMTFGGLVPDAEAFVQVIGGDSNWISTVEVLVNGTETIDWLGVADNGTTTGTASLLGFYATTDAAGQLQLDFSIASGNYAGIGGVIVTQIPEPATLTLLGLALAGLGAYVRRGRSE